MILNIFLFLFGLTIGSFLNVLIDRLPFGQSIMGRSHCDYCKKKLTGIDLIPIFSFIFQKGRCRYCSKKLSLYYPVIEFTTAVLFVFGWTALNYSPFMKFVYLAIISALIVVFFADLKYRIIPDEATAAIIIFSIPIAIADWQYLTSPFRSNVVAALVLSVSLYFLHLITRGKGMGFGDVKFAFAMGFLLGLESGLVALYLSFILGGLTSIALIALRNKKLKSAIAFGPFLVLGTLIMMFFESNVNMLLEQFFGL